jgi:methylmalonyl-CoA mutase
LPRASTDFCTLLENIEWQHCALYFKADEHFPCAQLHRHIQNKKIQDHELPGAIFWTNPSHMGLSFPEIKGFRKFGIFIYHTNPVDEIADALVQGVNTINTLHMHGLDHASIIRQMAFSLPVSPNFLVEIAKLKALRMLWYQVVKTYGITQYMPEDLVLHTRSDVWINDKFQPHGNMLKSTLATMAAVAGGCDAHTVCAEQEQERMVSRMARNNSIILKNESHLDTVADPVAGSYVIETMVNEMAQIAWKKFQDKV